MCLSPISIYNPARVVSLKHRDAFRLQVPCGKCAECQTNKSREWHFRTYYEFLKTIRHKGYVLFDTLTYRSESQPYLSGVLGDVPVDYPCFSRADLRLFFVRLRRYWSYRGYDRPFRYFLSCEYGTADEYLDEHGRLRKGQHQPHYHVLFFVDSGIPYDAFSLSVSKLWKYGRTDGIDYKGLQYVKEKRLFTSISGHSLKVANYVAKYVQKDSYFSKIVDARIKDVVERKFGTLTSSEAYSYKLRLSHEMCQFHLQSHDYGIEALNDLDYNELLRTGMMEMPTTDLNVKLHIPLPTYYNRKLHYTPYIIDGSRCWILNDLGKEYKRRTNKRVVDFTARRFTNWYNSLKTNGLLADYVKSNRFDFSVDLKELANYLINDRGRFRGELDYSTIVDKLKDATDTLNFVYSTRRDKEHFGKRFVTNTYQGNFFIGYNDYHPQGDYCSLKKYEICHCYYRSDFEVFLSYYEESLKELNKQKQLVFDEKQRLRKMYKSFLC